jgi:cobaltochelatase CobS
MDIKLGNVEKLLLNQVVKEFLEAEGKTIVGILEESLKPTIINIDSTSIKINPTNHIKFKDCVYNALVHKQIMLVGPTGSGKTTLSKQIAEELKFPFYTISCSHGMSEAHLLGRMLFDGTYIPSDFIKAYENGGVFLFDEIDAADNNTLLVINSAISNGYISVPNRKDKPQAKRHENFIAIVAGNTWGEGDVNYQGRSVLDRAFIDRFSMSKIQIDYDLKLEKNLCKEYKQIFDVFNKIREACKKYNIDRPVSTRSIVSAVKDKANKIPIKDIVNKFMLGWSVDEINKITKELNIDSFTDDTVEIVEADSLPFDELN